MICSKRLPHFKYMSKYSAYIHHALHLAISQPYKYRQLKCKHTRHTPWKLQSLQICQSSTHLASALMRNQPQCQVLALQPAVYSHVPIQMYQWTLPTRDIVWNLQYLSHGEPCDVFRFICMVHKVPPRKSKNVILWPIFFVQRVFLQWDWRDSQHNCTILHYSLSLFSSSSSLVIPPPSTSSVQHIHTLLLKELHTQSPTHWKVDGLVWHLEQSPNNTIGNQQHTTRRQTMAQYSRYNGSNNINW